MKQNHFLILFIFCQVLFVFLHIRQHMIFIEKSFAKQRHERSLITLDQQIQQTQIAFKSLTRPEEIKSFAQKELKLIPLKLHQVRKVIL